MVMIMKKIFNSRNLMRVIFVTFLGSIVFVSARIISAPAVAPSAEINVRVKSDYVLMLLQSVFGVFAMLLPGFLKHKVRLNIPDAMLIAYAIFLYCAIYLGEVRNFYYIADHWDTILHAFSGAALGALGFSVVNILNKSESIAFYLSPVFVALFAFCFALSLGVIWEIYEFSADYFLNTNMQKYASEFGEPLIGKAAIADTMKDLIVDAVGAFIVSAIGFVSLKYRKGWLYRFQVKRLEHD